MTLRDEIGSLASAFGGLAADLNQAKCAGRDRVVMFAENAEQIPLQGS